MTQKEVVRKDLDNQEFIKLRQNSELISAHLAKRLAEHLQILRPLFIPQKVLGSYIKTSAMVEVPGSDVAFSELKSNFEAIAGQIFGISGTLKPPLPSMGSRLSTVPYQYFLKGGNPDDKPTKIISPVKWIVSYECECGFDTLAAIVDKKENRQDSFIKEALIAHLLLVVFVQKFSGLIKLITDLRYCVAVEKNMDLGGLPMVVIHAPIETFLPTDEFITQITQLSGVHVFNEIIDSDKIKTMNDPFQESLMKL